MKRRCVSFVLFLCGIAVAHATTIYIYTNEQGTPLAEADASGNITAAFDYRPYGKLAEGASIDGPGYTGHVNDHDTGLIYMQGRYYDPEIIRFVGRDPAQIKPTDLGNFNRFAYSNDNPIGNIDPDGKVVTSLNASNNKALENYINANAAGTYAFKNGNLERIDSKADVSGKSAYYASKIDAAIASKTNVILDIADTYTDDKGNVVDVDSQAGGGTTQTRSNGDVNVTISGNANNSLLSTSGAPLVDGPKDILMHEVVGHAVPRVAGPDTGNAVVDENKARAEIPGLDQRQAEPNHVEISCGILCSR